MRRCTRVGIEVTKRCNWRCQTCFHRWKPDFNAPVDKTLNEVMGEVVAGKARGCDHAILVGQGEPGLWPHIIEWIRECTKVGMTTSIITNGSLSTQHYDKMREAGLNHLHVSVHGIGSVLDAIAGVPGAGAKQENLLKWLYYQDWPWRMNMTLQRENYEQINDIAQMCLDMRCRHIISLGFLPHYDWNEPSKMIQVAVHPAQLRPHIEKVAKTVENFNEYEKHGYRAMFTIRYHPMCHLDEKYRKYVVNARYVLYDPWEWDYGYAGLPDYLHWGQALAMGNSVAVQSEPCNSCDVVMHCGGWNRIYAAGFDGAELHGVTMEGNVKYQGWLHEQNPANCGKGYF